MSDVGAGAKRGRWKASCEPLRTRAFGFRVPGVFHIRHPTSHIRHSPPILMQMIDHARSLLDTLAADPNGPSAGGNWKSLHTLLKKAQCDQMRLARFIAERNVEAMRKV